MPNPTPHRPFWNDRRSITLTRLFTVALFVVCILVALGGPAIVDWLIARGRVGVSGPAVRWVMLGLGYLLAALALWMLCHLYSLLGRVAQGQVFVAANVRALSRIARCCALAALICIPAGSVFYFPFACMGIAAGFMALIVQVIKITFAQAVQMKDELDLTV